MLPDRDLLVARERLDPGEIEALVEPAPERAPLSALGGAAFLIFADLLARTLLAPTELPVGVVTALIGAPFFVILLRRLKRSVF